MTDTKQAEHDEHGYTPGPFEDTTTKTITVSPITITISESRKSTHVPPAEKPCGCGGGLDLGAILPVIMQAVKGAASDISDEADGEPGGFPGEGNPES